MELSSALYVYCWIVGAAGALFGLAALVSDYIEVWVYGE